MNDKLLEIIETWRRYWGGGFTQYLLLVAIVYLLLRGKKIKQTFLLIGYFLLSMFFFWFPITAQMINVCIGDGVYWRYLWIIPAIPYIAYAFADFCSLSARKFIHVVVATVVALIVMQSGVFVWSSDTFTVLNNQEKVPNLVADVCDLIKEDAGDEQVYLITVDAISAFARVYDPSIIMPYGRTGIGASDKEDTAIYKMLTAGPLNAQRLVSYAESHNANYMAFPDSYEVTQYKYIERHGFEVLGKIDGFIIYKKV